MRLTLRIPDDLHHALVEMASREQRSLNGQIVYLLQRAVDMAAGRQGSAEKRGIDERTVED